MICCPQYYNRCCPEPVSVVVNQTSLHLAYGEAAVGLENHTHTCAVLGEGVLPALTLNYTPLPGYALTVYVNGLLQELVKHYTIEGREISFKYPLTSDDVQVAYAYAVPPDAL